MQTRRPPIPRKIQPPIVPVLDVTFNLLIFFILMPATGVDEGYLTSNMPTSVGPVANKPTIPEVRIKVQLYDVEPNGEYINGAKNEHVAIAVEGDQLSSADGKPLVDQAALAALRKVLEDKRAQLKEQAATTPILLSPTMPTRHKWVVAAFDQAVATGFNKIHFAVPYD